MSQTKKMILAILSDLMFMVKIKEAAKRAGLDVVFVKTQEDVLREARQNPAVIILDLNTTAVEPLSILEKLKTDNDTKGISVLGFVSHVQAELKQAAQSAGCDMVIARSAFSQNLPTILQRYAAA